MLNPKHDMYTVINDREPSIFSVMSEFFRMWSADIFIDFFHDDKKALSWETVEKNSNQTNYTDTKTSLKRKSVKMFKHPTPGFLFLVNKLVNANLSEIVLISTFKSVNHVLSKRITLFINTYYFNVALFITSDFSDGWR